MVKLSIAVALFLSVTRTNAQDWEITTVATGANPSIDVDSQGDPHVAYVYQSPAGWIRYAVWNSPMMVFDTSAVSSGNFEGPASIALDQNDIPHINYHRHTPPPEQIHAYLSGSTWVNEDITDPNHDGWDNALAFDSNNLPRTSSVDPSNYVGSTGVEYAWYDGASWHVEQIGSTLINFFGGTSLAIDGADNPHITFYDDITDDLMYAVKENGIWSISAIETDGDAGRFSSLELDAQDRPMVSYYKHLSGTTGVVKLAEWNGASWVLTTVDTLANVVVNDARTITSLELDDEGGVHLSYGDQKVVKYASRVGSVWDVETVVDLSSSSTNLGQVTSLALTSGKAHIVYYEVVGIGIVKHAAKDFPVAQLAVTPSSLDFGEVQGGEMDTLSVLVQNIGAGTLTVSNILIDNGFFSVLPPTAFSLTTLDTHRVYVQFSAPFPDTGTFLGTMSFVSNDPSAQTVALMAVVVGVTSVEANRQIPSKYELLQNYPNPFNPVTTIEFVIRQSSFVHLTIHDLLGREVATLVNEKLAPGTYTRQWDAIGFTSGVYFYRLSAGELVQTRKLVLVR